MCFHQLEYPATVIFATRAYHIISYHTIPNVAMRLTFALSFLLLCIESCIASTISSESTRPGKRDDTSVCEKATAVTQNVACWARLGYNDWLETWRGPCPGTSAPGCSCDKSRPWSDCVLDQYLRALDGGDPARTRSGNVSCTDLMRPEQCQIPLGDWTRLSENDLAAAYVSTAVGSKSVRSSQIRDKGKALPHHLEKGRPGFLMDHSAYIIILLQRSL